MAGGRVLIIESDEWVSAVLVKFLTEAGFDVTVAMEARQGLEQARKLAPECIIADVVLPDIDGFWVARRLRAEAPELGSTPFLFLTDVDDPDARLQCLLEGSDLYLSKPVRQEEVVPHVRALTDMVRRLRRQDGAGTSSILSDAAPAFSGDIALLSVPTMLGMLEMERRTGTLRIAGEEQEAVFELSEGAICQVTLGGETRDPVQGVREVLRWKKGEFGFLAEPIEAGQRRTMSIGALLLEAVRLEDEER